MQNGSVTSKTNLKSLHPFLVLEGVLRIGGRLDNLDFYFKNHKLTMVIGLFIHNKYFHVGPIYLMNHIHEKFYPINGLSICRKFVHEYFAL